MDGCGHTFVDLVSVSYAPAAVASQSAIGEITSATELQATIGSDMAAPSVKGEGILFLTQSAIGEQKLLMSNEARLRLAAVTDGAQRSFCQNTLHKIPRSEPETQ